METKKRAIACGIGCALGTAVALIYMPLFWWLGALAGFGAGYLCYDLKEIREKAPIAWEAAKKGGAYSLSRLKKPRPFLLLFLILFIISLYPAIRISLQRPAEDRVNFFLCFLCLSVILIGLLLCFCASIAQGAGEKRRIFWENPNHTPHSWFTNEEIKKFVDKGYTAVPLTYKNIYGLILKGLLDILLATPKAIVIASWYTLRFLFRDMWILTAKFLRYLIILIHSQKRVLCGIDSAIGVAITCFCLGSQAITLEQKVMVVICGGIIGATVGVVHYKLAKLIHLVPATNEI